MQLGLIGLGKMGGNMRDRLRRAGHEVVGYDRNPQVSDVASIPELAAALTAPRTVWVMVPAGEITSGVIAELAEHLADGDLVIDGGNSRFTDDAVHAEQLAAHGIHFVDCGVSGGIWGLANGYGLMAGGDPADIERAMPIFDALRPEGPRDEGFVHAGGVGAGHYVKMVHNGIEYGDMELIAEAYEMLRRGLGANADELAAIFDDWNRGPLESFLIEITAHIFRVKDPKSGAPLVDKVLDKAGQKGTGKWTAQVALDLAVPVPTIAAAIDARVLSSMKEERVTASKVLRGPDASARVDDHKQFVADVHDALYASKICSYAQGMSLIQAGSREWKWNVNMREMARIWKAGCIIRARFLDSIMRAYERRPDLPNLLLDDDFAQRVTSSQAAWRRTASFAQMHGISIPAMSSSLAYLDAYRTAELPQNLTQAQRDDFGAHTYQRNDEGPDAPFVHSDWAHL